MAVPDYFFFFNSEHHHPFNFTGYYCGYCLIILSVNLHFPADTPFVLMEETSSSPLILTSGSQGKIMCTFSAVPDATVTIQKSGRTLQSASDSKLVYNIVQVVDSDAGQYICVANNSVGTSESVDIRVIVEGVALVLSVNCVFVVCVYCEVVVHKAFKKSLFYICTCTE